MDADDFAVPHHNPANQDGRRYEEARLARDRQMEEMRKEQSEENRRMRQEEAETRQRVMDTMEQDD